MRIEVVIDELVLHGFDARQRHAIADAVQSALARLVGQPQAGTVFHSQAVPQRDGGTLQLPASASASAIGTGIAARVSVALHGGTS